MSRSVYNCGAPLDYDPAQSVVRCAACGGSIVVPKALRPAVPRHDPLVPDSTLAEVATLFQAGKRVQATIRYREITGASLKEVQIAIERFAAGEPLHRPERW